MLARSKYPIARKKDNKDAEIVPGWHIIGQESQQSNRLIFRNRPKSRIECDKYVLVASGRSAIPFLCWCCAAWSYVVCLLYCYTLQMGIASYELNHQRASIAHSQTFLSFTVGPESFRSFQTHVCGLAHCVRVCARSNNIHRRARARASQRVVFLWTKRSSIQCAASVYGWERLCVCSLCTEHIPITLFGSDFMGNQVWNLAAPLIYVR